MTSQSCFCWLPWQQVDSVCGEGGQLDRLRSDLSLLNTSTHSLDSKLTTISLNPGRTHICVCVYVCVPVYILEVTMLGKSATFITKRIFWLLLCEDVFKV